MQPISRFDDIHGDEDLQNPDLPTEEQMDAWEDMLADEYCSDIGEE